MRRGQRGSAPKKFGGHHCRDGTTSVGFDAVGASAGRWVMRWVILASSPLQWLQAARRLSGSYQLPPRATGVMWSTVFAVMVQPGNPIWQVWLSR